MNMDVDMDGYGHGMDIFPYMNQKVADRESFVALIQINKHIPL
jgi:hypothetical protein